MLLLQLPKSACQNFCMTRQRHSSKHHFQEKDTKWSGLSFQLELQWPPHNTRSEQNQTSKKQLLQTIRRCPPTWATRMRIDHQCGALKSLAETAWTAAGTCRALRLSSPLHASTVSTLVLQLKTCWVQFDLFFHQQTDQRSSAFVSEKRGTKVDPTLLHEHELDTCFISFSVCTTGSSKLY
jgi:hypothetical protein